jgi:proteasome lid subunit RPN8/RPN11
MMITIVCPRRFIREFEAFALSRHPREVYAALFGRRARDLIEVLDVWYPEDQAAYSSTNGLFCDVYSRPWRARAETIAESHGWEILGDIHSHPQTCDSAGKLLRDAIPSEIDWGMRKKVKQPSVMGITVVGVAPRKRVVRTKLWLIVPHRTRMT